MSVNSHPDDRARARKAPVQERSRRTVDVILSAAAHIFEERGYTGTTTNHVAEAAGVSIGTLYQYFPHKDALLVALEEQHLRYGRERLQRAALRWRSGAPSPRQWCASLVDELSDINDDKLHLLLDRTAPTPPYLDALVGELVEELATAAAGHLRRWQTPDPDLRARVLVVVALRAVHDLVIHSKPRRRAALRREVIRLLEAYCADANSETTGDRRLAAKDG